MAEHNEELLTLFIEYKMREISNEVKNKYSDEIYRALAKKLNDKNKKRLKRSPEYLEEIDRLCMEEEEYAQLAERTGPAWETALEEFGELEPDMVKRNVLSRKDMNRFLLGYQARLADRKRGRALKRLEEMDLPGFAEENMPLILEKVCEAGEKFFRRRKQRVWILDSLRPGESYRMLEEDTCEEYLLDMLGFREELQSKRGVAHLHPWMLSDALKGAPSPANFVIEHSQEVRQLIQEKALRHEDVQKLLQPLDRRVEEGARRHFTIDRCLALLAENPVYGREAKVMKQMVYQKRSLMNAVFESVPDDYIDLYPAARKMQRHFILHVGGTNSGKTHNAMEALRQASSGIYLAPLRLLAYEQFDRLNMDGYPCDLITGEEEQFIPFARYQASTIEMADYAKFYDVAVIDEGQMIDDPERGGNWTGAILGILADEIHVCMAPEAEDLIRKIIAQCGDTYEVRYYERKTPLLVEWEEFDFPRDIRQGDALIAFSRKKVHSIASRLKEANVSCSLIYGALPHDVRHREAERFLSEETEVVVSTDAIGMGMNLPIRRIVFLEMEKFDGVSRRELKPAEVKQIAGRAGRYGLYETGYVTSLSERELLAEALEAEVPLLREAVISVPIALLSIDAPLSEILQQWNSVPVAKGFKREDVSEQISRAQVLEKYTDDKLMIYRLVMIPFDEKDEMITDLWEELSMRVIRSEVFTFADYIPMMDHGKNVESYERDYKLCDMLYAMVRHFGTSEEKLAILMRKQELSHTIFTLLSEEQSYEPIICRRCGRELPWNYKRGLCRDCMRPFDRRRGGRRGDGRSGGRSSGKSSGKGSKSGSGKSSGKGGKSSGKSGGSGGSRKGGKSSGSGGRSGGKSGGKRKSAR